MTEENDLFYWVVIIRTSVPKRKKKVSGNQVFFWFRRPTMGVSFDSFSVERWWAQ